MEWAGITLLCVIAAAVAAVAVFVIRLVRTAQVTLEQAGALLEQSREELQTTTRDSQKLIQLTTLLLQDLQSKLHTLDHLFSAADRAGQAAHSITRSVQAVSTTVEDTLLEARRAVHSSQDSVNELLKLTSAGIRLWHLWQEHKQAKTEHTEQPYAEQSKKESFLIPQNKNKDLLVGALVGSVLGAVTALLFAPKSGKELRADIAEGAGRVSETTLRVAGEVADKTKQIATTVGEKTQAAAQSISKHTAEWADKAKNVIQLKNQSTELETAGDEEVLTAEASVAATTAEAEQE